jgi:hypothetical protein
MGSFESSGEFLILVVLLNLCLTFLRAVPCT